MTLILSGTNGVSDIDGDASTPALRGTDANSGVFFGSDVVGVSTGGSEKVSVGASALVINDGGADFDFRVEGDTNANLLFVDASADAVGIGTNAPSVRLEVSESATPTLRIRATSGATGDVPALEFFRGTESNTFGNTTRGSWRLKVEASDLIFESGISNTVTERMRIDSSGNLLVGTTSTSFAHKITKNLSDGYALTLENSTTGNPYGLIIVYSGKSGLSTANEQYIKCEDSTTLRMEVRSNGGIANYSANNANLSDRKEKTNFAPAKNYLDTICAIPVQTFNYIDQNLEDDPGLTLGVVAQDVQEVAPELVIESNWGTEEEPKMRLSIYQTDLQYALMKCIQELKAELDAVKETNTALEARIAALEAKE